MKTSRYLFICILFYAISGVASTTAAQPEVHTARPDVYQGLLDAAHSELWLHVVGAQKLFDANSWIVLLEGSDKARFPVELLNEWKAKQEGVAVAPFDLDNWQMLHGLSQPAEAELKAALAASLARYRPTTATAATNDADSNTIILQAALSSPDLTAPSRVDLKSCGVAGPASARPEVYQGLLDAVRSKLWLHVVGAQKLIDGGSWLVLLEASDKVRFAVVLLHERRAQLEGIAIAPFDLDRWQMLHGLSRTAEAELRAALAASLAKYPPTTAIAATNDADSDTIILQAVLSSPDLTAPSRVDLKRCGTAGPAPPRPELYQELLDAARNGLWLHVVGVDSFFDGGSWLVLLEAPDKERFAVILLNERRVKRDGVAVAPFDFDRDNMLNGLSRTAEAELRAALAASLAKYRPTTPTAAANDADSDTIILQAALSSPDFMAPSRIHLKRIKILAQPAQIRLLFKPPSSL